jgi:hypothetical protein
MCHTCGTACCRVVSLFSDVRGLLCQLLWAAIAVAPSVLILNLLPVQIAVAKSIASRQQ